MTDWWGRSLLALLVWPGLIGGSLAGWLLLWLARKLTARVQGRKGPPFCQPFFDFAKLLGKQAVVPGGVNRAFFHGLPLVSVVSSVPALSLIPAPGNRAPSFAGDLILLLYLLEMPAICEVLAGYGSRSLYGQVGAAREALLWLGYNVPLLTAVLVLAARAHSFDLRAVVALPLGPVHLAAAAAFLIALPARLKSNPFSIPNAEQEIVAGPLTEYQRPTARPLRTGARARGGGACGTVHRALCAHHGEPHRGVRVVLRRDERGRDRRHAGCGRDGAAQSAAGVPLLLDVGWPGSAGGAAGRGAVVG